MRLFVAVDLPAATRAALAAWARDALGGDDRLRLVREESLHLTLAFLGELQDAEAPAQAIAAALDPPPPSPLLRVGAPLWLAPRRPHVLTVALEDPGGGLGHIHAAVLRELVRRAGHEAERRAFRPHVTVARVRGRLRPFDLAAPVVEALRPPAVTLYRSRLGSGPAVYERVSSVPLSTLS